jgi:hypothetical protein
VDFASAYITTGSVIVGFAANVVINWITSWNATGSIILGLQAVSLFAWATSYTPVGQVVISGTAGTRFSVANYDPLDGLLVLGSFVVNALGYREITMGGFRLSTDAAFVLVLTWTPNTGISVEGGNVFATAKAVFTYAWEVDLTLAGKKDTQNKLVVTKVTIDVSGVSKTYNSHMVWPFKSLRRFIHTFDTYTDPVTEDGAKVAFWAIANSVDGMSGWEQNNSEAVAIGWDDGLFFVRNFATGEVQTLVLEKGVNYHIVVARTHEELKVTVLIGDSLVGTLRINIGLNVYDYLFNINTQANEQKLGTVWTSQGSIGGGSNLLTITTLDNGVLLAGNAAGKICRSTDAGATWSNPAATDARPIFTLCDLGGGVVLAGTGQNDYVQSSIYRSDDYGQTWVQKNVSCIGGSYYITQIRKLSSGRVMAGLYPSTQCVYSDDMGLTWAMTSNVPVFDGSSVWDFMTCSGGVTLMAGVGGYLNRSMDGGMSWTVVYSNPGFGPIYGLEYCGSNVVIATGEGFIARSANNGDTWSRVVVDAAYQGIQFPKYMGNGVVVAASRSGHLFTSIDMGQTWVNNGVYATSDPENTGFCNATAIKAFAALGNTLYVSV